MEDTRTLAELAREALQVQDACNLSGVVHGFSRAVRRLREVCPELDSNTIRTNPVVLLWVDKLSDLVGRVDTVELHNAYRWCEQAIHNRLDEVYGK